MPAVNPPDMKSQLSKDQRLLGLDIGEKTIGLALSDVRCSIASPHETIARSKFSKDMEALRTIIKKFNVGGLVVGYPVNMDGSEGPRCQSTRQFCRNMEEQIQLPVALWDERLSTMAVDRAMLEADLSRAKRAEHVDKLAASYILQGFLDFINRQQ